MRKQLWRPAQERVNKANITKFAEFVGKKYSMRIESYRELYNWSVLNIPEFWSSLWEFANPISSHRSDIVVDDLSKFPGAKWFEDVKLNFAENLLRYKDDRTALIFKNESGKEERLTYAELNNRVTDLANSLRDFGVVPGDRLGAYMPNSPATIIAMLATTSIGAVWASCGVELGTTAVLERLGQIKPKILFAVDGYAYRGKSFGLKPSIEKLAKEIPTLDKVIIFPYLEDSPEISDISKSVEYEDFLTKKMDQHNGTKFEQLPFNHPLYIMFSSGTTGKPKSMVQGAGGVLLNHLKELILHTDLKRDDRITYITSPSWMMWNWLVTCLAVGATIVLYDGDPNHPNWRTMWKLIEEEAITIFGCSASYINHLRSIGAEPREEFDLSSLREISQTGSPLSAEGFEWIYQKVKADLHFNSISGGTDINGCFAIGNPTIPVYAGEVQAPGLGMKIKAYDDNGNQIFDREGELVCEAPTPSMPLYFWNDPNNERYVETYFNFYKSKEKNVWRHGDYVLFHGDTGGITFFGRSDSVLKPSGVRIGTAEIYNIIGEIPEIADSLAVGQNWEGNQRIILFVQLRSGKSLTDDLKDKIRRALSEKASRRHVPALILEAPEIPYTYNLKKVEVAVANIINGRPLTNRDALANPDSLDYFKKILKQIQAEN